MTSKVILPANIDFNQDTRRMTRNVEILDTLYKNQWLGWISPILGYNKNNNSEVGFLYEN